MKEPAIQLVDKAGFVRETYPDNTTVTGGTSFTKTWTIQNTGTTTWDSSYKLRYVGNSGSRLGSASEVAVSGTVLPNATYTFSVAMTAPTAQSSEKTYKEDWQLTNASGSTINVGDSASIWAQIAVPAVRVAGPAIQIAVPATQLAVPAIQRAVPTIQLADKAGVVTPYMTTGDKSNLLKEQPVVSFSSNSTSASTIIKLTPSKLYQTIDGFGFSLTEGSAEVIRGLSQEKRSALLKELIDPISGIGVSVIRISIGASDLSSSLYSYNEIPNDFDIKNFSLTTYDTNYVIPVLQEMLDINQNIKILATPWTAPTWMKTDPWWFWNPWHDPWKGGHLKTEPDYDYYDAYANYFVKFFQAMAAVKPKGINIWAITPQNEPKNIDNVPSMSMTSAEQIDFIKKLGPKMVKEGFSNIKIIAYDHNCNDVNYPIDVLNHKDSKDYVDGAAFHLYEGDISAMTTVKDKTNKNVYFTEQWTQAKKYVSDEQDKKDFSDDFGWHMQNVVLGSLNNWSKTVIEWNLATNADYGPHTPGGCKDCKGASTISNNVYSKNVSYYIIGQVSKVVQAGATRIDSSSSNAAILCSAFKNSDGSMALIAYNKGTAANTIKVENGSKSFIYSVPAQSAVSFKWTDDPIVDKFDKAGFVRDNPTDDTPVPGGTPFIKTWTIKNTGTTTWNSSYKLRYVSNTGSRLSSTSEVAVSGTVLPNASYTFSVTMTAPAAQSSEKTYKEDWKLTNTSGSTINVGNSATVWAQIKVPAIQLVDKAGFVRETYLDNTTVTGGTPFTKTWTIKNTGTTTWNSSYKLRYVSNSGSRLSSTSEVAVSGTVLPNATYIFSVAMKAPTAQSSEKPYREDWKLTNASATTINVDYSSIIWVLIKVPRK